MFARMFVCVLIFEHFDIVDMNIPFITIVITLIIFIVDVIVHIIFDVLALIVNGVELFFSLNKSFLFFYFIAETKYPN